MGVGDGLLSFHEAPRIQIIPFIKRAYGNEPEKHCDFLWLGCGFPCDLCDVEWGLDLTKAAQQIKSRTFSFWIS